MYDDFSTDVKFKNDPYWEELAEIWVRGHYIREKFHVSNFRTNKTLTKSCTQNKNFYKEMEVFWFEALRQWFSTWCICPTAWENSQIVFILRAFNFPISFFESQLAFPHDLGAIVTKLTLDQWFPMPIIQRI